MNFQDLHFIRPEWLLLFVPLLLLLGFLIRRRLNKGNWEVICDDQILPYLLIDRPTKKNRWALFWFALGGILGILAMAGPSWERLPSLVFRNESALVMALDLSASMDAQDIKPSRLDRAKYKIRDILSNRKDGQTALVVFAGDAYTVTPLTDDTATIANNLSALSTALMPAAGSRSDHGLQQAEKLLKQAGLGNGHILLISDGVKLTDVAETARRLKSNNFVISVLAVGTEDGAPIPISSGGFLKDSLGNIVIPHMSTEEMRRLADLGGGAFQLITSDNRDVEMIGHLVDRQTSGPSEQGREIYMDQWQERGPWLLLLLLPIAAFAFRKGVIAVVLLVLSVPGHDAFALSWDDLWATPDQQAIDAFNSGQPGKAAQLFENPHWKGVAQYKAGELEEAVTTFSGLEDSESLYNKGNGLANLGRYREALKAYSQALQQDPNHQDALFNKKLIEEQLKNQKSQSDNSSEQNSEASPKQQPESQGKDSGAEGQSKEPMEDQSQKNSEAASKSNETESSKQNADQNKDNQAGDNIEDRSEANAEKSDDHNSFQAEREQSETNSDRQHDGKSESFRNEQPDESKQADEQWLRRIPDDPGRLLREKFRYQYSQRRKVNDDEIEYW